MDKSAVRSAIGLSCTRACIYVYDENAHAVSPYDRFSVMVQVATRQVDWYTTGTLVK